MVHFFFKSILYLFAAFILLSFPIKQKSVFYYLNQFTLPYTQKIYNTFGYYLNEFVSKGKSYGKGLFSNSVPKSIPKEQLEGNYLSSSHKYFFSLINKKKFLNSEESANKKSDSIKINESYSRNDLEELKALLHLKQ